MTYKAGTVLNLRASVFKPGTNFTAWTGACAGKPDWPCHVSMNGNLTVGANFTVGGAIPAPPPGVCPARTFKDIIVSAAANRWTENAMPSTWSYKGFLGIQAGDQACKDIGADHVCTYREIVDADAKGELNVLPRGLTYWLHRTTNVASALQPNKSCRQDSDCRAANDSAAICDPTAKVCSWTAGAGARCMDWTTPGGWGEAGEWFSRTPDQYSAGGVVKGSLSYHFLKDSAVPASKPTPVCNNVNQPGCAGACQGTTRAIACCFPRPASCP
jgi:hypothetical protein